MRLVLRAKTVREQEGCQGICRRGTQKKGAHLRTGVPLVKVWLEVQLQAELDVAREVRAVQRPKSCSVLDVGVYAIEIGVVEGIEEFTSELQPEAFRNVRILDEADVPVLLPGTEDLAIRRRAVMTDGKLEGGRVEPFADRFRIANRS